MADFNTVEEAIEYLKQGKPILTADDENRENEGDVIFPAEFATPELVNFMMSECKGIVCLALDKTVSDRLELTEMVQHNTDAKKTAFTQSIDASQKFGVTTGVSAFDRAKTIKLAASPDSKPSDFTRPGHVFPLIAKKGGVLERVGHTEASVDLMKYAGLTPAAVICEVVKPDGSMARRDFLFDFAKKHDLKFVTVSSLIKYRLKKDSFVKRVAEANLPTQVGMFKILAYKNELDGVEHVALVKDDGSDKIPMVRVHSECLTGDTLLSLKCDCGTQLKAAIQMINDYGKGALVYIRGHEGRGIGIANKIKAYALQDKGEDTVEANVSLGFEPDLRHYGVGAQILSDLGYSKINLITNNPKKIIGLSGYGLEIVERIEIPTHPNKYNEKYLKTKVEKMEHMIHF